MPNWNNQWLCIQTRADVQGQYHIVVTVYSGATAEDAANRMLETTHLQEGWTVRRMQVAPYDDVAEWEVEPSANWRLKNRLVR